MDGNIKFFLEKFKTALGGEEAFKEDFCLIVKEKTTFTLSKKHVSFKGGTVRIGGDPYLKTEIFLNKESILESLREKHPQKEILDII